ncbi:hypothetical protein HNR19_001917 [Nocardioides thalensis]|uniref:WD40 repeat domain-containing protein n=1 Tax=Nocardioides thalensis TaxID=1914755 RepID=A0A853C1G8_9ACTN|nr:hypothetical protein [Nocardioides thalensis]NYJ01219.1 hypothetical protein [Nocardioides thalensis]
MIAGATVALVAALGIGWWQQSPGPVAPASAEAELRLPDRFYEPSGWLPGTEESGPIGPLVAVIGAERSSWTGGDYGVVGVSGETGDYRFLDLPVDALTNSSLPDVALSPDGRYLAFWTATASSSSDVFVEGVAVYDTVTGETDRRDFDAPWGMSPEGMIWTGHTLWVDAYRFADKTRTLSRGGDPWQWAPTAGWKEAPFAPDFYEASAYGDDILMSVQGRTARLSLDGAEPVRIRMDLPAEHAALGPGGQIAGDLDTDGPSRTDSGAGAPLVVGTIARDGTVDLTRVPEARAHQVVAWRDERTVVVRRFTDRSASSVPFLAVDVRTGESTVLVDNQSQTDWLIQPLVAADAWAAPTYDAPEPPSQWDPRLVLGGGVAVVLAGGIAVLRWRRRVRP